MAKSEKMEVPEDLRVQYDETKYERETCWRHSNVDRRRFLNPLELIERIARAEAQVRSLTERLQRMGRPVTDEEWESATDHCPCEGKDGEDMSYYEYYKGAVNALIAARMESK